MVFLCSVCFFLRVLFVSSWAERRQGWGWWVCGGKGVGGGEHQEVPDAALPPQRNLAGLA